MCLICIGIGPRGSKFYVSARRYRCVHMCVYLKTDRSLIYIYIYIASGIRGPKHRGSMFFPCYHLDFL